MTSSTHDRSQSDDVAIVGIGCRFPGQVDGPRSLWRLLCDGVDAVGEVPIDRFDATALREPRPRTPGRVASTRGGFVDGIELLDAGFFGIAPREAALLDPQQRLLLETACEALDDAGLRRDQLAGSATGVFVGAWIGDLEDRAFSTTDVDFHSTTGTGRYALSGRLSYFLDLRGPSFTLDTACSSSLVAVHLATRSLSSRECDLALVGGVNVILEPSISIAYSQMGMMSPDGRCKFGDASADGYVRSDGAATVALKRLRDAEADGDLVYAVIRGSAVTNDGRSGGKFVTPGQAGHEDMLRRAYDAAGLDPRAVHYVEAHGTGTAVGDPVELRALGAVVGAGRPADEPCLVGSIKSNIGHTEGAAGVAGLVKAALALRHAEVPASLHVRTPNPSVPWDDLGVAVCTAHRPWPGGEGPRFAGVSAFGISGTNAHVVLESAPAPAPAATAPVPEGPAVLVVSARDAAAVGALAGRYRSLLERSGAPLLEVARAAALRRTPMRERLAVVADRPGTLAALAAAEAGEPHPALVAGRVLPEPARVVFVFPGQGSQWIGMARDLLEDEGPFTTTMAQVSEAIEAETGWSPIARLTGVEGVEHLDDVDVVQPLLFAVQVSLAAVWRSWGVEPAAVIGHSMGEVAAAYVAGALDLSDAVAVICRRSALLRRIAGAGAMAVVDLPAEEVELVLRDREDVSVAVSNSPRSTVIGGSPEGVDAVLDHFGATEVFCRRVQVDVASHTSQVEPLLSDLVEALGTVAPRRPSVPFESTVDDLGTEPPLLDAGYWARNLRQTVQFGAAVARQVDAGASVFLEISPHPVLQPVIGEMLGAEGQRRAATAVSLRRGEPARATMLRSLAGLWVEGVDVAWADVLGPAGPHVELPMYPWQRERHWRDRAASTAGPGSHRLLGRRAAAALSAPGAVVWESVPGGDESGYLLDHVVRTTPLVPATALAAWMLAAADAEAAPGDGASSGPRGHLTGLRVIEPLPVDGRTVATVLQPAGDGRWSARVLASVPGETAAPWHVHAEGVVEVGAPSGVAPRGDHVARAQMLLVGADDAGVHTEAMRRRGLDYGPLFQTVRAIHRAGSETVARLEISDGADGGERAIRLLDGAFQAAIASLPVSTDARTVVPVGAELIDVIAEPGADALVMVTAVTEGEVWTVDLDVVEGSGRLVARVVGLRLQPLGAASGPSELEHELVWRPADALPGGLGSGDRSAEVGSWVVYAAEAEHMRLAERLRATGAACTVVVEDGVSVTDWDEPSGDAVVLAADDVDAHRRLLEDASGPGGAVGIVYCWATRLSDATPDDGERIAAAAPIALLQALGDASDVSVWFVTRGAQPVAGAPTCAVQAVLWGLGRVVATERPAARPTLVDLDPHAPGLDALLAELIHGTDLQVAVRDGRRHVARLVRSEAHAALPPRRQATDSYRVAPTTPGLLDGVAPVVTERRPLGPGEVELLVEAAGLNFIDVLKAMGEYPGLVPSPDVALGAECAGRIVAVGAQVDGFEVDDQVIAITPSYDGTSLLARHVTLPAAFVRPRPEGLDVGAASALPVAYVTALIALRDLARVRPGDRVLVHAGSGGVGLAAIEVCRMLGVDALATAGSPAKRDHLRERGVEHVFDSRTTAFAQEVLDCTDGRGVDVVLNSLTGDLLVAGLSALAPGGRFVEIGKRDIHGHALLDLASLRRNVSFHVLDLAGLTTDAPDVVADALADVVQMVAEGLLAPLPTTEAPIEDVADLFRTMARAEHVGKLVVRFPDAPVMAERGVVRADRTYVVTGGLGALGLEAAVRLADLGARHLALLGRTGPGPEAEASIAALRDRRVEVVVLAADVTDMASLEAALAEVRRALPPLGGVVHAAGTLADATIDRMDPDRLHRSLAPKLAGAWNLHRATSDDELDHFVLFSSVAGVLGLAGQANYAAGNAYLDALAAQRRGRGLAGTSISWGPWAEIGLATADPVRGQRLAGRGMAGLGTGEGLLAFERSLADDRAHLVVTHLDPRAWIEAEPAAAPLLQELVTDELPPSPDGPAELARRLSDESPAVRRRLLEELVAGEVALVLKLVAARVDRSEPLKDMGLDSLMALELRNRLESVTGLTFSATVAFNHPTVVELAAHVGERLGAPVSHDAASAVVVDEVSVVETAEPVDVADVADDELLALLGDELSAIDRLLGSEDPS